MNSTISLYCASIDSLSQVSESILKQFPAYKMILFKGDLGAGKTSLIKNLCKLLGVESAVSSPTFSLVNEYETSQNDIIYHFDFYRIKDVEEAFDMGVEEYFESGKICLIEWPEMIEEILPEKYLEVNISLKGEGREYLLTTKNNG